MKYYEKVQWLLAFLGLFAYSVGACLNGGIRLHRAPTLFSPDGNVGRVEVCQYGVWGTITLLNSRDFWSEKNIQVACLQLGFSGGLNSIPPIDISKEDKSPNNMPVHFFKVSCNGGEMRVADCDKRVNSSSSHDNDVFIVCRPERLDYSGVHVAKPQIGDFLLFGNKKNGIGAVKVLTSLGWSGICPDSSWTVSVARVFCNALGYDVGHPETFEADGLSIFLSDAQCSDLPLTADRSPGRIYTKYCSFSLKNCTAESNNFAGIRCDSLDSSKMSTVRLFGIDSFREDRVLGVVEVFEDNKWGMVCSNRSPGSVDGLNAMIICTTVFRIDFADASSVAIPSSSLRKYESNLKPLWADDILCSDNASLFSDCRFKEPVGYSNCSGRQILGVDCGSRRGKEAKMFSIIIGTMITVFLLVLLSLIIIKLICSSIKKDRSPVTTSFPMSEITDGLSGANHLQEIGADDGKLVDCSNKSDTDNPQDCTKVDIGAVENGYANCLPSS